ncbi:MAG: glycosyltransferase [Acidobacteriota bacterium]
MSEASPVLWSSPLPPTRSGVADLAAELLPELARYIDVRVVEPPGWTRDDAAPWLNGIELVADGEEPPRGSIELLHLGNNPYHLWIAGRLRARRGIAVVHDTVLHHLLVEEAAAGACWERYRRELDQSHGTPGAVVGEARRWGYVGARDPFLLPARLALLGQASGAIVHSAQAERDVTRCCPDLPLRRVPLAVEALPEGDRAATRARLGVAESDLLLAHLGFLTPAKGMAEILRALSAAARIGVPARLMIVGEGEGAEGLVGLAGALDIGDRVTFTGYVSRDDLGPVLAAADVGLVPRHPTAGETSAAALRFLSVGTPVIVSGYRQFLELPEAAAWRITPGPAGVAELVRLVLRLHGERKTLADARPAARSAWSTGRHDPAVVAPVLAAAIRELAR